MILFEFKHDILSEIGHVFSNDERLVTALDFLVLNNSVIDLLKGPASIFNRSQQIILTSNHVNRHFCESFDVDLFCETLIFDIEPVVVLGRPFLEPVLSHVLAKVKQ